MKTKEVRKRILAMNAEINKIIALKNSDYKRVIALRKRVQELRDVIYDREELLA